MATITRQGEPAFSVGVLRIPYVEPMFGKFIGEGFFLVIQSK
jgi:hypothetical protein